MVFPAQQGFLHGFLPSTALASATALAAVLAEVIELHDSDLGGRKIIVREVRMMVGLGWYEDSNDYL